MIDLKATLGGAGPIGSERWFHKAAASPLLVADGATYLRSGNIIVNDAATYPDAFANFKISRATVWASLTASSVGKIYNVKYVNGAWWGMGANSMLLKSTDGGTTWVQVVIPTTVLAAGTIIYDMAYNNGVYCLLTGAKILFSYDGNSWQSAKTAVSNQRFVTAHKAYFVSVGINGQAYQSLDGVTWTGCTSGISTSYAFAGIVSNGERFVAFSSSVNSWYGGEDPSVAWSTGAMPAPTPSAMAYADGVWLCGGGSGSLSVSFNGTQWSPVFYLGGGVSSANTIQQIAAGAGEFVLATSTGANFYKMTNIAQGPSNIPTFTLAGPFSGHLSQALNYGAGTFLSAQNTTTVPTPLLISTGDSIGFPSEYNMAGGEVVKYMRIK